MENLFGITKEEIEAFETPESRDQAEAEALLQDTLLEMATNLTKVLKDPAWLEKSKIIARLPGLSNQVKISAILMGAGSMLSQLLLLHMPAKGKITVKEGMSAFTLYGEMIGMSTSEITEWISLYFNLGIIEQKSVGSGDMQTGPLAVILSAATYPKMEGLWSTLLLLKSKLEQEMGLEFVEDRSMLVIPVESLAP